ncbi:uncharacterized protein LOC121626880 [Chelmon rostratus]|uniref:uncharacterized protein LOC121626880 n=1 Tax=Chelmon rostratus TaxID=109905 RepID=UPI001BEC1D02|nr:uncharacterized protein LOC121626880 [Chelmon rostratus]XP_041821541.1 uncharacterized protein LOC121626880 [Chelmon rostratus]XP_041821542.1 uncharacterized protein LOC121626880 [Chelmon rostratus]
MIFILVLVGLAFAVCGSVVNTTPTVYQAKENDNITIRWDITTKTEMSHVTLLCFFSSKPLKVLYKMSNAVEVPESQHQQFAGRVQCDQDALREGRVRLHVSTVTADDSGSYWCELAANYDPTMVWTLRATEHFVLNVTSGGESADDFPDTPKPAEEHFVLNVTSGGQSADDFPDTPKPAEVAVEMSKPAKPEAKPASRGRPGLYAGLAAAAAGLAACCWTSHRLKGKRRTQERCAVPPI